MEIAEAIAAEQKSGSFSIPLGLHIRDGKPKALGAESHLCGLNHDLDKVALRMCKKFLWSSIQLNFNTSSVWHSDIAPGRSILVVVGTFEGGEFESEGRPPSP